MGDAGVLVKKSDAMVNFTNCAWGFNQMCQHAATMVWKKEMPEGKIAILLMNNMNVSVSKASFQSKFSTSKLKQKGNEIEHAIKVLSFLLKR